MESLRAISVPLTSRKIKTKCVTPSTQEFMQMTNPLSSTKLNNELEYVRSIIAIIGRIVTLLMAKVDEWLLANHRDYERVVMCIHASKIIDHATALAECIAHLDTPSERKVLLLSGGSRIGSTNKIVETEDAYDEERLNDLDKRDIQDAIEFETERKDMFGLAWMDEELRVPLSDALQVIHEEMERNATNVAATSVKALKALLKGHSRGFAHYYTGADRWPRPSAEIQAEIDAQMPDALEWLRYELKEALEEEAASTRAADCNPSSESQQSGHGSAKQQAIARSGTASARHIADGLQPGQAKSTPASRCLPIEADDSLRKKIEAHPTISAGHHLNTLDNIKLLLLSETEKDRVFCGGLGRQGRDILNDLLTVAIGEIEEEHATVVGIVDVLIERALDIYAEFGVSNSDNGCT